MTVSVSQNKQKYHRDRFGCSYLISRSAWNKLYHRSLSGVRYHYQGSCYEDHPVFYQVMFEQKAIGYVHEPLYMHSTEAQIGLLKIRACGFTDVLFFIGDLIFSIIRQYANFSQSKNAFASVLVRLGFGNDYGAQMMTMYDFDAKNL